MAALKLNLNPNNSQLRQFGFIALFAFPLIGWMFTSKTQVLGSLFGDSKFVWDWGQSTLMMILGGLGLVCGTLALAYPQALKYVFLTLSIITFPIGLVVSELVMVFIYYVLFVPVGLFFKMTGRDALDRRIEKQASTYWAAKPQARDATKYYRQS